MRKCERGRYLAEAEYRNIFNAFFVLDCIGWEPLAVTVSSLSG
jgi:hypothetical protein